MTKVINRKKSCFLSLFSILMFSLSWSRKSQQWWSRSIWRSGMDQHYCSYNRTCKGDYVRPFQPCHCHWFMIRCKRAPFVVQSLLVLIGKKKKKKDKQKQNQNMKQGKGEEGRGGEGMFAVKEWWENHFYPAQYLQKVMASARPETNAAIVDA